MRKYNEGYSLVLVLVVLTVIALLATFILSFSLSNLQNQQASLNRMQEDYAAAGEIEKYVAKIENFIRNTQGEELSEDDELYYVLTLTADTLKFDESTLNVEFLDEKIQIKSKSGDTVITYVLFFQADKVEKIADKEEYKLSDCTGIGCEFYEISREVAPE